MPILNKTGAMLSANIYSTLLDAVRNLAIPHITVGFSGGADSSVLLHLLHRAQHEHDFTLDALHIHHGLHPDADQWVENCKTFCHQLNIPLTIRRVSVNTNESSSIEAEARTARYAAFAEIPNRTIALAHHADDQSETFLLGALRGGGLRALSAMPVLRTHGNINLWRPLLSISRQHIEDYAAQYSIDYITDSSNYNTNLLRNWIRHQWLPCAKQHLPQIHTQLHAAINLLQDELALLDEISAQDWAQTVSQGRLNCTQWQCLSAVRRRNLLLQFTKHHQLGTPRRASVIDFEHTLATMPQGHAEWHLPNGLALSCQGTLFALPNNWIIQHAPWLAHQQGISGSSTDLAQNCGLIWQPHPNGLPLPLLQQPLSIRQPHKNDTLITTHGHKSIKKILSEHGIPKKLRQLWPILTDANGKSLAVVGIRTCYSESSTERLFPYIAAWNHFIRHYP